MNSCMTLKGSLGFEGFRTIFTAKYSLFSVRSRFMHFESFFDFECLLADVTEKLFVICMNQFCVSVPVGALGKLLWTKVALKRFFSSVNPCVQYNAQCPRCQVGSSGSKNLPAVTTAVTTGG